MKRVLISCPPMLLEKQQIKDLASAHGVELVEAQVVQTLREAELIECLPQYDGWIAGDDPATAEVIRHAAKGGLRAIVKWGIGVDNIDLDAVARHQISFQNTPGMFSREVADLAMGYLIALTREITTVDRAVREGNWIKPQGISLYGKTAAVIGLGNIGQELIRRLHVCGVRTIGYDPYVNDLDGTAIHQWPDQLKTADFVFLCCALTADNHHLLNEVTLDSVKQNALIINVSRGPLIDQQALVKHLRSGRLLGAALDVYEDEPLPQDSALLDLPRLVLGSHNASNTKEAVRATNVKAVELVCQMLQD